MANKDTVTKTISVAFILCVVCSIIVSMAAVQLRPAQKANKALDIQVNILKAAGLYEAGADIDEAFESIETKLVDLSTGKFSEELEVVSYDQIKAAKNTSLSDELSSEDDIASLSRREKYAKVYVVNGEQGIEKIVLPIRGYGLWSTLKGFIALESDLNTVVGLGYYEHGETPGLGGEVDNPRWKGVWPGKKVYSADGSVALSVIKGIVSETTPNAEHKVDGLSGATLTSDGVDYMVKFWLGDMGYAPFLTNLKNGEA
ncbi:MAG: Na(+)-translocating NADH-quinone reductase subunit C [Agarilytica sp.]